MAPGPTSWRLSGFVSSVDGQPIGGAVLVVLDGPNAGASVATSGDGQYVFPALEQAAFTVRAEALNHVFALQAISLTGHRVLDFTLAKLPTARLEFEGDATGEPQRDGVYAFTLTGVNRGDGCASGITGVTNFSDRRDGAPITSRPWALPATTLVRPGERFPYRVCCLTLAAVTANPFYVTEFTYATVACPR
jgi:hypothetical protein